MKVEYFESADISDVGRKRKNNEDACLRLPEQGIYCVADGMGGVVGGDLASEAITTNLQEVFKKAAPEELSDLAGRIKLFRKAANQASQWIKRFADEKVIGQMGSTVVALLFYPPNPTRAVALHAGDSRLHRFRDGALEVLTADHSAVAALAAKLGRDPESLPAKYQNELLRAVGLAETVELERTPVEVRSGDLFLLCSDGLTRMVPNPAIEKILSRAAHEPLATVAKALIDAANEAGGKDNITAVLVRIGDLAGLPPLPEPPEEPQTAETAGATPSSDTDATRRPAEEEPPVPDTAEAIQGETPHTDERTPQERTPATVNVPATPPPPAEQPAVAPAQIAETKPVVSPEKAVEPEAKVQPPAAAPVGLAAAPETKPKTPAVAAQQPKPAPPVSTPSSAAATQAAQSKVAQPPAAPGGSRKGLLIAGAVVVVVIATGLIFGLRRGGKPAPAPTAVAPAAGSASVPAATLASAPKSPSGTPMEPQTQQKQAEASAAQQKELSFQTAFKAAQAAFEKQDFGAAVAQADAALALKAGNTEAAQLKQGAQTKLSELQAAQERELKYQAAMQTAQAAFQKQDFAAAVSQANAALDLKPGDAAATQLKAQAIEAQDLATARRHFAQAEYDQALAVCARHADSAALRALDASVTAEQRALASATSQFTNGDYGFLAGLKAQSFIAKKPFADLLAKAAAEARVLAELQGLKEATNWQAVAARLAEPAAAGFSGKPPFRALAEWAKSSAAQAQSAGALDHLDGEFETMLVWFNIKGAKDPYIRTTEGRNAKRIDGGITEDFRKQCLDRLAALEDEFRKGGWLNQRDRAKYLAELRTTIAHHE